MRASVQQLLKSLPAYLLLGAGDLGVFLVFPTLGTWSHTQAFTGLTFVRNVLPFALAWFIVAPSLGGFRFPTPRASQASLAVLRAWAACGPAGLVLRSWWFHRPWAWSFAIVALLVQAALLVVWRVGIGVLLHRRPDVSY